MPTRRQALALGCGAFVALAGCADEETAEFVVTNVQPIHRAGDDRFDYPEDILYRVSIENTGPNRQEGRVEMTLTYDPEDGEGETWSKTDDISLGRGRAVRQEYVFENVYVEDRDIDDYTFEAEIVQDE